VLKDQVRHLETDKTFDGKVVDDQSFTHHIFTRLTALKVRFVRVDFRYTTFDACYLRKCTFDSCDFTGARFVNTNLHGSGFTGCKFGYVTFEKTIVDSDILDMCCPPFENLKARFARTLRMNYQSLGDASSANKAILVELEATEVHLHKAWQSNESYYRQKYQHRARAFVSWSWFTVLDFVWGNGERPWKLVRTVALLLLLMGVGDALFFRDAGLMSSYWEAFLDAPQIFMGAKETKYPGLLTAAVIFTRLIVFGLFLSILIRRLAQR